MAELVDLVLVIGSQNSSNCNRLKEVADSKGVPSYLINGPEDLKKTWLLKKKKVGITSGASTPESIVNEVISALKPNNVLHIGDGNENISFRLPKELQTIAGKKFAASDRR